MMTTVEVVKTYQGGWWRFEDGLVCCKLTLWYQSVWLWWDWCTQARDKTLSNPGRDCSVGTRCCLRSVEERNENVKCGQRVWVSRQQVSLSLRTGELDVWCRRVRRMCCRETFLKLGGPRATVNLRYPLQINTRGRLKDASGEVNSEVISRGKVLSMKCQQRSRRAEVLVILMSLTHQQRCSSARDHSRIQSECYGFHRRSLAGASSSIVLEKRQLLGLLVRQPVGEY